MRANPGLSDGIPLGFLPTAKTKPDLSLIYPTDPTQLPEELNGVPWPPKE